MAERELRLKDISDEDVILALLEHPSDLNKTEKTAFEEMVNALQSGRLQRLSPKQRDWVRNKFEALDLLKTFNAGNLASAAKVTGAKVDTSSIEALERMMGPKPAKPPMRKLRMFEEW